MPVPDIDTVLEWRGRTVLDASGEKIGKFHELYLDSETDRPEWAGVIIGVVNRRQRLVPLSEAKQHGAALLVPFDKEQVESSPDVEAGGELSQEDEAALYRHYGLEYSRQKSATGLAPEGDQSQAGERADGGEATAGSEEDSAPEQSSGEETVQTRDDEGPWERVRLKKYVTTQPVTKQVPVEREEIVVEREVSAEDEAGR
jgi:hypothetical protein